MQCDKSTCYFARYDPIFSVMGSPIFCTPIFPPIQYFFADRTFYAYILFHIKIFHIKRVDIVKLILRLGKSGQ
jgi:hypothetical protein